MDKAEAVRTATAFMAQQSEYDVVLEPSMVLLIQASERPDLYTNDVWIIHFSRKLPDEILFQEPDTVMVRVNVVTHEVEIANSM